MDPRPPRLTVTPLRFFGRVRKRFNLRNPVQFTGRTRTLVIRFATGEDRWQRERVRSEYNAGTPINFANAALYPPLSLLSLPALLADGNTEVASVAAKVTKGIRAFRDRGERERERPWKCNWFVRSKNRGVLQFFFFELGKRIVLVMDSMFIRMK